MYGTHDINTINAQLEQHRAEAAARRAARPEREDGPERYRDSVLNRVTARWSRRPTARPADVCCAVAG